MDAAGAGDLNSYVAFEFIGAVDHLGEVPVGTRTRGSMTTSADAAIRYRAGDGEVEIALIEWKYTEDYRGKELSSDRADIRRVRYRSMWDDPAGPVRTDVIPYDDLFVEPFCQLLRQQLLAWALERAGEACARRARVVHVSPPVNMALRSSLNRPSHLRAGPDVFDI